MDYLVYLVYRAFTALIGVLPLGVAYRLGQALGLLGYALLWPYRRLAIANLTIAYGDALARREIVQLARTHFATLGANLLSSIKAATFGPERLHEVATVEGMEIIRAALERGKGVVLIISHIGNWELFAQLCQFLPEYQWGTVYQPLGNRFIEGHIQRMRAKVALFSRKNGFNAPTAFLRAGGALGVLVDQHAGDGGVWTPFFGRLASTSPLAALLALRTEAELVPLAVHTDGHGALARGDLAAGAARGRHRSAHRTHQPGARNADQPHARRLVLGAQPLEDAAPEVPAGDVPARDRPAAGGAAGEPETVPHPGALDQLAGRRRDDDSRDPGHRAGPARRADHRAGAGKNRRAVRRGSRRGGGAAHSAKAGVFAVASVIRRAGAFDAAVVLPNSLRSALEVFLAGVPRRVGFAGHRRRWLLNQVVAEPPGPFKAAGIEPDTVLRTAPERPHQSRRYAQIAREIGAGEVAGFGEAPPRDMAANAERGGWLRLGLCPGAEYGPTKRWLPERFAEAAKLVAGQRACEWVLFGVEKDLPLAEPIVQALGGRCENLIGKTTLAELIAALQSCHALLTNDTGTMHLAAWLGVPTVAVFGSTDPVLTGPLAPPERVRILRHQVECSPCFLKECPLDLRCMKAVGAEEAAAAVLALAERS